MWLALFLVLFLSGCASVELTDLSTYAERFRPPGTDDEMPQINLEYIPWASEEEQPFPNYTLQKLDPQILLKLLPLLRLLDYTKMDI